MRHTPLVFVLAAALASGCAPGPAPAPAPDPVEADVPDPLGPPAAEPAAIEAMMPAPPGTYDQPVDVRHYDLELALSDTARWIRGRAAIDVALLARLGEPLELDFTGLAIDRVTVDGRPVDFTHVSGRLGVPLGGVAAGDTVRVGVDYRGVPDDGLIIGDNVHGQRTVFADNWPNRARFWFPGVDHPSDKATVRFTVHAPAAWEVIANGALLAEPEPTSPSAFGPAATGARRTWHWGTSLPIPTYTMVVGAGDLVVRSVGTAACGFAPAAADGEPCVDVTTWVFPPDTADAAPSFRRAAEMVTYFTDLFGAFPYEKLANVQSSTRFGGMENSSAIFYAEAPLAAGRDIEGTVSHEIAHQWFGDMVTEADWSHLWLSEGFATYFGDQFFEAVDGPETFRRLMRENLDRYLASDDVDEPVIDPDPESLLALLNRNNYQKGALVLHALRGIVGDDAFFRGVRAYADRFRHGTALTDDFRRVLEEASGEELGWFFEQWLHRPGYPVLAVETVWDDARDEVVLTVRQEQDVAWPTFRLPTEVEIAGPGGTTVHPLVIEEREQTFRFPAAVEPTSVRLDPVGWLPARWVGTEQG